MLLETLFPILEDRLYIVFTNIFFKKYKKIDIYLIQYLKILNQMIAFLKIWIFLLIIFQNQIFMNYIIYFCENKKEESFIDRKLFLTIFSIILLYLSAVAETTYQTILRFGFLLFFSPFILFLNLGG